MEDVDITVQIKSNILFLAILPKRSIICAYFQWDTQGRRQILDFFKFNISLGMKLFMRHFFLKVQDFWKVRYSNNAAEIYPDSLSYSYAGFLYYKSKLSSL